MRFFIYLIIIFFSISAFSQEKNDIIQQRIEFIAEQLESESIDLTTVFDQLNYYIDHPLNLNFATYEELESLGVLTEIQIKELLLHIKLNGKLISIVELQSLKYWYLATIQLIMPFVKVDDTFEQLHLGWKEALKHGKYETILRYQTIPQFKSGYSSVSDSVKNSSSSYYFGNRDHYYSRFRFAYRDNLSIGITGDKDPGEQFFKGSQKQGFDFYSFHAFYKGGKYLKSIALGDYQVQIGQGLNCWSGFAFGKTADMINVKKSATALRPYTSTDENRFFRGTAFEVGIKNYSLLTFVSVKKMDATLQQDTSLVDFASSLQTTGYHRTSTEIARKNSVTERILGTNLKGQFRNFKVGIAAVYQGYNDIYSKQIQPYNQFDFRGKEFVSLSADYNWIVRNVNFFGEIARTSFSGAMAQLHGILISLDSKASLSVVYRNYGKAYQTMYNSGFSEGTNTQNEKGLYSGLKFRLLNSFEVNSYLDLFSFPWLKYQVDKPSLGHEIFSQITYKPTKQLEIYGRFREQVRQKNSRISDGTIPEIENIIQRNYRLNLSCTVSESIVLKTRIEYVTLHRPSSKPEKGVVLSQDVLYKPKNLPIDITLRYALFQTDSYDSRIYIYESNAQNIFSIPAYYYQGSRAYLMVRYTLLKKVDIWVRYGSTIYSNRKSIGTGSEEIQGSVKSDVSVQIRFNL